MRKPAIDERILDEAALRLSGWVLSEAARAAESEGFGWATRDDAPVLPVEVRSAYELSKKTRQRLPVPGGDQSTALYAGVETAGALRFLQAVTRARLELDDGVEGDLAVAVECLQMLRRAGHTVGSAEWHLLHADTVGQLVATCVLDRAVLRPRDFDYDCVRLGLREAIELERGRVPAATRT